jgi:hypothetical protein
LEDENALNKSEMFNDGVWVIKKLRALIPEDPFEVLINGKSRGMTKLFILCETRIQYKPFPPGSCHLLLRLSAAQARG